jgi:hypothetical protein
VHSKRYENYGNAGGANIGNTGTANLPGQEHLPHAAQQGFVPAGQSVSGMAFQQYGTGRPSGNFSGAVPGLGSAVPFPQPGQSQQRMEMLQQAGHQNRQPLK